VTAGRRRGRINQRQTRERSIFKNLHLQEKSFITLKLRKYDNLGNTGSNVAASSSNSAVKIK